MKLFHNSRINTGWRIAAFVVIVGALIGAATLLSTAQPQTATITVVNNSGWTIQHIYLSPPNQDNWGPDQLNNTTLGPGASVTINSSCSGSSIKVITEDQDGCFLSNIVSCSGNATWTIAGNSTRDCD
jgi:hypothetical protein